MEKQSAKQTVFNGFIY